MSPRYHIASLSLDTDGTYWISVLGAVGEPLSRLGRKELGFSTMEGALSYLKEQAMLNEKEYVGIIKESGRVRE